MQLRRLIAIVMGLSFVVKCVATTHYVSLSGSNNSPYLTWANAATQIQWAVDSAVEGDTVLVSNGTYYLTNQITITSAITVTSVNGKEVTLVDGNYPAYSNRVSYLSGNVVVDGFTITNGYADQGGGVLLSRGTIRNCLITGNNAAVGNQVGGGVFMLEELDYYNYRLITNCIIENNHASSEGGGIHGWQGAWVVNCIIRNNDSVFYGGGICIRGNGWSLRNCLIYNNESRYGGGIHAGATNSTIVNCTIVSNYATTFGGGIRIDKYMDTNAFINCIVYSNICTSGSSTNGNVYDNWYPTNNYPLFSYCCSTSNRSFSADENNNITGEPMITDWSSQNYRLRPDSPCLNTGTNQDWMTNAVDLDGRTRIRYGTVDMGAYETMFYNGTIYRIH